MWKRGSLRPNRLHPSTSTSRFNSIVFLSSTPRLLVDNCQPWMGRLANRWILTIQAKQAVMTSIGTKGVFPRTRVILLHVCISLIIRCIRCFLPPCATGMFFVKASHVAVCRLVEMIASINCCFHGNMFGITHVPMAVYLLPLKYTLASSQSSFAPSVRK